MISGLWEEKRHELVRGIRDHHRHDGDDPGARGQRNESTGSNHAFQILHEIDEKDLSLTLRMTRKTVVILKPDRINHDPEADSRPPVLSFLRERIFFKSCNFYIDNLVVT